MVDLADGLNEWMNKVDGVANLSVKDRSEITGAGAAIYSKILRENTPRSTRDYSSGRSVGHAKGRKHNHIQDAITYKPGWTIDRYNTGDTSVGWKDGYTAMVARFVNDGTKVMSPKEIRNMHFKDRAESLAKDSVLKAEEAKYKEVVHSDRSR